MIKITLLKTQELDEVLDCSTASEPEVGNY